MILVKSPTALIATFLRIGFACAVSFMEAWLKFRAPGITLPIGLSIGRLAFNALNKVEWVFAIAILANLLIGKSDIFKLQNLFYVVPVMLLFVQTIWLLPALDARTELHIRGQSVPPSNLHFYYAGNDKLSVILKRNVSNWEKNGNQPEVNGKNICILGSNSVDSSPNSVA